MVNKKRLLNEFIELVGIDSLTFDERMMADTLKHKLEAMGLNVEEDDAGSKIGGNTGNLICTLKGSKDVPAVVVMAHMDTVSPGIGKKPIVKGDIIRSDGNTVLGGDDAAGIACILETIRVLREDNLDHGDIQVVFSVAEEGGLLGSKNLDYSRIYAKYGFVMDDSGSIGHAAVKAPAQNKIDIAVKGKAAHAGVEPERGVSAVQIASRAISAMKLGRIDFETTANIGVIKGGYATNIICDRVDIKAEARSRNEKKLDIQTRHMEECFKKAADELGGKVEFISRPEYPAFSINRDDEIISILQRAAAKTGFDLKLEATGGGSDTNIINSKGIQAVDLSVGMDKVHSVDESISADDMARAAVFLAAVLTSVE